MGVKLGSDDVSFRLGAGEVAAVYLGATQVYSAVSVPGAPTGLEKQVSDYESLIWTAPTSDGGSPITGYIVYLDGVDVTVSGFFVLSGPALTPTEWAPNGSFSGSWTVAAVNAVGTGPQSAPLTASIN
jgi:hypothetical protein